MTPVLGHAESSTCWGREPLVRAKRISAFPYRVVDFVEHGLFTVVAVAASKGLPGYWKGRNGE